MPRSTSDPPSNIESRIDELYGLPLDQFVTSRNALATELGREKRTGDAARVKALARPSLPAWALNQVYWHARGDYDRLTAAGDRMRELQRRALGGHKVDLDEATRERQQAVRAVVDRAAALMLAAGQPVTDATRQRITATADTIAAYGSRPREYTPGRLERELSPPGFEALAGLAAGTPPLRLVKPQREEPNARVSGRKQEGRGREAGGRETQAREAAAREARRQQLAALREAREAHRKQEREVERARREETAAAAKLDALRRELEAARAHVAQLEEDEHRAVKALESARRTRAAAEFESTVTSSRLRQLEASGGS